MFLVTMVLVFILCVFFFKQKTAYEMRISDWSSDVCSSDLGGLGRAVFQRAYQGAFPFRARSRPKALRAESWTPRMRPGASGGSSRAASAASRATLPVQRSDGRRVGKEGVRQCRSRWSPDN